MVPSPAVGKWLTLRLADNSGSAGGFGCIANLEMVTLERFLWKVLAPAENMQPLDAAILQQVICALLNENLLQESCYGSVAAYLEKDHGVDPVKRVQLASRIAHQFQEYEFNRPSVWDETGRKWRLRGIDAHWLNDTPYFGRDADNELWQKDLYRRAQKCLDNAGYSDNVKYISLPHLYRLKREESVSKNTPWAEPPGHIFLFGVTKVSHFFRNTLVEISQMTGVDMHVFLANPCAEFWEDVDTRRNHGRIRRVWKHDSGKEDAGITARSPDDYHKEELKDIANPPPLRDHTLLELWGNAGKANIFLWCAQAQWNFEYHSPGWVEKESAPVTLLKAVQYSLLRRENTLAVRGDGKNWNDAGDDGSLKILAGPDPSREVEELREQILDFVEMDGNKNTLRLNDIVVYIPDPGAYVSHINRVFGAIKQTDPGYIPYSILGAPGSDSLFSQGMHTLLDIFDGRYDRAHVFTLLRNPIVQATRDISPDKVTVWEGWAEELGIFRGYNRRHRMEMGDLGQTETDAHTFELGIARCIIGNLSAGPLDMKYRLLSTSADSDSFPIPAFRDFDTTDSDSVEMFCCLAEDLYKDAKELAASLLNRPLSETIEVLTGLVRDWFGILPDEISGSTAAEGRVRNDFLDALPSIVCQESLADRKERMDAREFFALVRDCLPKELPAEGSKAWTGGITFAPLRPAMIVPHRVIFCLGLDATTFPGTNEKPGWNLLSGKHIVGDSDPVRDNRFAFLELLHSAKERLILSFRGRNMQKEEELTPSSVLLELESYLRSQGLLKKPDNLRREDTCLIRHDIPWIVRESLDKLKLAGRIAGSWDPAEKRLDLIDNNPEIPKAIFRYGSGAGIPENDKTESFRASIYDLRRFFANPLEYHLARTLGIENNELPSTISATDEPLLSGKLEMATLQKAIWTRILLRIFPEDKKAACSDGSILSQEAEYIAKSIYREYLVEGKSPEAQFGTMEENFLVSWARACVPASLDLLPTFPDHRLLLNADLALGRPGIPGDLKIDIGEGRDCSVECRHNLALVPRNNKGEIGIILVKKAGEAKENPDLWLTGVVQWLWEQKCDDTLRFTMQLVQLNRGNNGENVVSCDTSPVKLEDCGGLRHWLAGLIRDMLIRSCAEHLPFAVIQDLTKQNKIPLSWDQRWASVTGSNIEDRLSDKEHGPYRCFLEAFALVDARIPFSGEADESERDRKLAALARSRFELALKGMES
jgi:exonuclease V gamma subunit